MKFTARRNGGFLFGCLHPSTRLKLRKSGFAGVRVSRCLGKLKLFTKIVVLELLHRLLIFNGRYFSFLVFRLLNTWHAGSEALTAVEMRTLGDL